MRKSLVILIFLLFFINLPVYAGDIQGKLICGYQAWFYCYGDGAPMNSWMHWPLYGVPGPGNIAIDVWPDVTEYPQNCLFDTNFSALGNGLPDKLFSCYKQETIDTQFRWMQEYGIDCAAVQRFGSILNAGGVYTQTFTDVLQKIRDAAEATGRKFYVTYDLNGLQGNNQFKDLITHDWQRWVDGGPDPVTTSSAYAREDGKLVVELWGMAINGAADNTGLWQELIDWFHSKNVYVISGCDPTWRSDSTWKNIIDDCQAISPWFVGRFTDIASLDSFYNARVAADISYCNSRGILYIPVIWPGFSWANWNGGLQNHIPRNKGSFMWRQVYNCYNKGLNTAYVAMFDEYDEGTAIMKAATDSSMTPDDQWFVTMSADGEFVSSDFYLRLTGKAGRVLKGIDEITVSVPIPLTEGPVWLRTGLEGDLDPKTTWSNNPWALSNVGPHSGDSEPKCVAVTAQQAHHGTWSILCKGKDLSSAGPSYAYFHCFDVNIPVNETTQLSYWIYPQQELGRHVAVDFRMTDNSTLRDSGALDQHGIFMHPASAKGVVGRFAEVKCNVGKWLAGRTIDEIYIAYDYAPQTGDFVAWIDDIVISDSPADINRDQRVDLTDYSALSNRWMTEDYRADFNGDRIVNSKDLQLLAGDWLSGTE